MPPVIIPKNEAARLAALMSCNVLDTADDPAFDSITQLTAELLDVPICLVSLVDETRQWFKSRYGLDMIEISRDLSFCAHAILQDETLVIEDATKDERTCDNPVVTGKMGTRFYAGHPLILDDGHAVGTLCIIDTKPRSISNKELSILQRLAGQVTELLHLKREATRSSLAEFDASSLRQSLNEHTLFCITDRAGRIVDLNDGFCKVSGYSRAELLGKDYRMLNSGHHSEAFWGDMCRTIHAGKHSRAEVCIRAKDGSLHWVDSINIPRTDAEGKITGVVSFCFDITDKKRVESELARALAVMESQQERLEHAVEGTSDGLWDWPDVEGQYEWWSPHLFSLLGYEPDAFPVTTDLFASMLHPDDREPCFKNVKDALEGRKNFDVEFRMKTKDRGYRWFRSRAKVYRVEGKPVRMAGSVSDIQSIRDAIDLANQASKAKSDFLANMSHEIRTPMSAILGYSDLLGGELANDPVQAAEAIRTIQSNASHLLTVINDILDVSKIEAGQMAVEAIRTSPSQIISEVLSLVRPRAESKGVRVSVQYDTPFPEFIQSDPTRLRQILLNLMGNAIKFTEVGSVTIHASCDPAAQKLQLNVVDTGIGMSHEQCKIIARFNAFSQADSSTTRRFGGTGLGLCISNALAEMLGGRIVVSSVEGKGSTFTATLATGELAGVNMLDPSEASLNRRKQYDAAPQISASSLNEKPLEGMKILLAEDGPDNQRLISFHLKKAGAVVTICENGRVAAETLESASGQSLPHLVLMDMQMPELDGYGATGRLRQGGFTLPIIALTAHAMAGDRQKCMDAGCDDYLTKPIEKRLLIETCLKWSLSSASRDRSF